MGFKEWIARRRAEKATKRRLDEMGKTLTPPPMELQSGTGPSDEKPTATGTYEIVKRSLDEATGVKHKARSAAKRILSLTGKGPKVQLKK